jgi:hypothetical protein
MKKDKYLSLYFSLLIAIVVISCSKENGPRIILNDSDEGRRLKRQEDSVLYQEEKKRYPSSTLDLLPINSDTLIAVTRYNGIITTLDAGQTWALISAPGTICKLTIDNQKTIWGLYSWRGIHEADRSILHASNDFGSTWVIHELNTREMFPADFYSPPGDKLKIIDYDRRIYQLVSDYPELKWQVVDSLDEKIDLSPWVSKEFVIDSKKRRWLFNSDGIFLVGKDTTKMY